MPWIILTTQVIKITPLSPHDRSQITQENAIDPHDPSVIKIPQTP
jgi:hypothetical protein